MKLTTKIAQDGRFSIMEGVEEINIRTSLVPGAYGESIVMRILDPKTIQIKLEDMGIEPFLIASSIVLVAAQRLCRVICKAL